MGSEEHRAAQVGTLVHAALEAHYKGHSDPLSLVYQPEVEDWELALRMVEGYLEWLEDTGVDAGLRVEAVEETLRVEWPRKIRGDRIVLEGHIDLLATDAFGVRKLMDHKTVQSLEQYSRQLQVDDQMLTYAVMLKLQGIEIGGTIHNALKRVKRTARAQPPFYQRNEVVYNVEQLRAHYFHLEGVLNDMVRVEQGLEGGEHPAPANHFFLYPTPNKDCTWDCAYMGICAAHDDGSDIESMIAVMKERMQVEQAS